MAKLSGQELSFYKTLYTLLSDQTISDSFNYYFKLQRDRAVDTLKEEVDINSIFKLQGRIKVYEELLNLKSRVAEIMKLAG